MIPPPGGGGSKPREYTKYKSKNSGILLPLVQTKRWATEDDKTLLPFIQDKKQANRAMDILVEVNWCSLRTP